MYKFLTKNTTSPDIGKKLKGLWITNIEMYPRYHGCSVYTANLSKELSNYTNLDLVYFKEDSVYEANPRLYLGHFKNIFHISKELNIDDPKNFIQSNIVSVYNLLENFKLFSKKYRSKLIHISTDEVFGDILKGRSKEEDPYRPSSPYAASKASSDHLVYSYIRTFKIPAIITNCSNNYGPRQHPEKLIPKLIYNILNNKNLPIYGKGKNSREWIYVDDHCEALIKIFKKGKIGNFYNIGSNLNLNNIKISELLIKIAKSKFNIGKNVTIKFVKDRPGHDIRYALNSNKLIKNLKWKPKVNINNGLNKTFDWYLNNPGYYSSLKKKDITQRLGNKTK